MNSEPIEKSTEPNPNSGTFNISYRMVKSRWNADPFLAETPTDPATPDKLYVDKLKRAGRPPIKIEDANRPSRWRREQKAGGNSDSFFIDLTEFVELGGRAKGGI